MSGKIPALGIMVVGKKAEKSCFLEFVSRSESECRSGVQVSSVAVPGCWDSSWAGTGLDVADCCAFSKMNLLVFPVTVM